MSRIACSPRNEFEAVRLPLVPAVATLLAILPIFSAVATLLAS
jgi:hypothetical protein